MLARANPVTLGFPLRMRKSWDEIPPSRLISTLLSSLSNIQAPLKFGFIDGNILEFGNEVGLAGDIPQYADLIVGSLQLSEPSLLAVHISLGRKLNQSIFQPPTKTSHSRLDVLDAREISIS